MEVQMKREARNNLELFSGNLEEVPVWFSLHSADQMKKITLDLESRTLTISNGSTHILEIRKRRGYEIEWKTYFTQKGKLGEESLAGKVFAGSARLKEIFNIPMRDGSASESDSSSGRYIRFRNFLNFPGMEQGISILIDDELKRNIEELIGI